MSPASRRSAPVALDVGDFVGGHAVGDVRVFDAEGAAKAAADLWIGHFGQGQAWDPGQQLAGLGFDAEFPQAGAGIVDRWRWSSAAAGWGWKFRISLRKAVSS